ncbi:MAG: hypothetical protein CO141_00040 [Candidatus Moranbacteria bacterium CG_4_9_14_3_um_filter_42_9]|nr:MAG: hypothetical protein CO141_00040 [Candidatus Moranbacteria bacterium CG_4_9_14_3_um_filter_42_9]
MKRSTEPASIRVGCRPKGWQAVPKGIAARSVDLLVSAGRIINKNLREKYGNTRSTAGRTD